MSVLTYLTVITSILLSTGLLAQETAASSDMRTATCALQDGVQVRLRYVFIPSPIADGPPMKQLWMPGGLPMVLYTEATLEAARTLISPGAYFLYVIPDKENWTLIINKNVTGGAPYDEQQDVVRVPMNLGSLTRAHPLRVALVHSAPRRCVLRIQIAEVGAWMEFQAK